MVRIHPGFIVPLIFFSLGLPYAMVVFLLYVMKLKKPSIIGRYPELVMISNASMCLSYNRHDSEYTIEHSAPFNLLGALPILARDSAHTLSHTKDKC